MKNWLWLALAIAIGALYTMKDNLPDLVGHQPAVNPLVGRWDVVSGAGYIRFTDYGFFRYHVDKKRQEGTYQLLPGGAIEFSVTQEMPDYLPSKRITRRMDVRECKCFLDGNRLFLDLNGRWVEFEKARDVSAVAATKDSDSPE